MRETHRTFGSIFLDLRNNSKLTLELLSQKSGLDIELLRALEADRVTPSLEIVQKLADALTVNVRDFFGITPDTDRGIKILRVEDRYRRTISRKGKPHYTYEDLVVTRENVNMRPEILTLLCTSEEDVVMNEGHFLHQLTLCLHSKLRFFWRYGDQIYKEDFKEGDSWYIRPYVPHAFMSLDPDDLSKILAFTFGGSLTSDAVNELGVLGQDSAKRVAKESTQWYRE